MKRLVLIYGLIAGLIVASLMGVSISLYNRNPDMEHSMLIGYASMLLAFAMIFVAVKTYRDKQSGGTISFGKAFTIGLSISLIASTIYVAVWALEYQFLFPDFLDKYCAAEVAKMKAAGASAQDLLKQTQEGQSMKEMYKNPFFFTLMTYAEILPVGLLVSLITALVLKRRVPVAGAA